MLMCWSVDQWGYANLSSWQTYVLDVHPFNPRIAMSAGYDGRTIVWDVSFLFPLLFFKFSLFPVFYRMLLSFDFFYLLF